MLDLLSVFNTMILRHLDKSELNSCGIFLSMLYQVVSPVPLGDEGGVSCDLLKASVEDAKRRSVALRA